MDLTANKADKGAPTSKIIRLDLAYEGTEFCGWQVQVHQRSVQGVLEEAIYATTGERLRVRGCSRTDAGVHARGYVASFISRTTIPSERLVYPLNQHLPRDVRIHRSSEAAPGFDARRCAAGKTYSYTFSTAAQEPVLGRQLIAWERGSLDEARMQEACVLYQGTHDFRAFRSQGSSVVGTVRTLHEVRLEREGDLWRFWVTGNGFLYNMVRILVGTLFEVGHHTKTLADVRAALAGGDRLRAGRVAKPEGLILERVYYENQW
ncbi:tRNA pseudouridine synthase A [Clostridiaceae bacterium JG1575]|nr:tRNA pseudouridine synthase A [Clostridiaceae bacterium JG1575]